MAEGSILGLTSNYAWSHDVNYYLTWETETKLGPGTLDFWTSGTDLVIPSDINGKVCELFMYCDGTYGNTTDDGYLGVIGTGNLAPLNWYGIKRDFGLNSRGYRSGPIVVATGDTFKLRWKTFGTAHESMLARGTKLGILVDQPIPLAFAFANGDVSYGLNQTILNPAETYDPDGIYNPTTGVWTAPAGAECFVAGQGGLGDPVDGADTYHRLNVNGVRRAEYLHAASSRSPGPGCWGLQPCSPGDEITMDVFHNGTAGKTQNDTACYVEFY